MTISRAWTLIFILFAAGCARPPAPLGRQDLTGIPFRDASPRWSPDGSRIAFLRIYGNRQTQLWIADASLSDLRPLTEVDSVRWARPPLTGRAAHAAPDAPAWSPDGRRIAVSRGRSITFDAKRDAGGTDLWTVEVDSGAIAPLAVHPEKYDGDLQFFRAPAWSPTGKHIAYLAEGVYGYSSLVVHTLGATRSSDQAVPIDMLDDYGWPAWSPDGKWLAYRQAQFQSESALPVESVRLTAPGTTRSRTIIVKSPLRDELWRVSHMDWNQDSKSLMVRVRSQDSNRPAFTAIFDAESGRRSSSGGPAPQFWRQLGGSQGAYWIDQLGENRCRLKGSVDLTLPSDDFDVSPNGRLAVFHDPQREGPTANTSLRVLKLPGHP